MNKIGLQTLERAWHHITAAQTAIEVLLSDPTISIVYHDELEAMDVDLRGIAKNLRAICSEIGSQPEATR